MHKWNGEPEEGTKKYWYRAEAGASRRYYGARLTCLSHPLPPGPTGRRRWAELGRISPPESRGLRDREEKMVKHGEKSEEEQENTRQTTVSATCMSESWRVTPVTTVGSMELLAGLLPPPITTLPGGGVQ